ncbi:uncharacterized protein B0P05DRAFT_321905 [Gilbertella persicaria]|uniref:uncharacterized protein n=1 Tax=Gilbertella persicaria TaxID=101096 RepID=UPI00221E7979|nr:uncharacterized protein B0P05DRAFT_321905 [Gilbertella persicaria]KAI8049821.1 hypothetical protein B0P05DRAFT_321905 [Gilbertella persicaria]
MSLTEDNPLPSSVIIVNESTPLISHEQQLAAGQLHTDTSFSLSHCLSFSRDERAREQQIIGLGSLVMSSFLFAGVSVIVKWLNAAHYPSFQIVLARACVQLPLGLLGCLFTWVNPFGKKGIRRWIFFRALASSVALILFFHSLTQLPLLDATVIFFVGPVFKVIIACIVFNERFSTLDVVYILICFGGLLLVGKSSSMTKADEYERSFAVSCALAASLMSAMAYMTVKKVGQGTHLMVHVVYFGWVTILLCLPVVLFGLQDFKAPVQITGREFVWMAGIGLLAFFGQSFINMGLKKAPMGPVTVMRTGDILFAFLFGVGLFKEIPGVYTILGTLIIVCMTTCLSMYRWHRQELKAAEIRRRKLRDRLVQRRQEE